MNPLNELQALVDACRAGTLGADALVTAWRSRVAALPPRPSRFDEVLENILMRLESTASFADESCSFSRAGLLDNLEIWLRKLTERTSQGAMPRQT